MDGTETIQTYIGAELDGAPNPQLRRIDKVSLTAGEEKTVEISLKRELFMLCDESGKKVLNPGVYHIYIGGSQPDARSRELTGQEVVQFTIRV